ncbi:MAG: DoxX family protein [Chitinophagaceae bacterium]|nr:DoxX family protein [Chitinophagaceae bacterium]
MKKLFSTKYTDLSFNIMMFLLRAGFGTLLFLQHGLPKLMDFAERKDRFFDPFGVGPTASLILVIFAEVFCSLFLVLGLFTRLSAFVLVVLFLVIVFMAHRNSPLSKMEDALLFLFVFAGILLCGPGKWSIDNLIGK